MEVIILGGFIVAGVLYMILTNFDYYIQKAEVEKIKKEIKRKERR